MTHRQRNASKATGAKMLTYWCANNDVCTVCNLDGLARARKWFDEARITHRPSDGGILRPTTRSRGKGVLTPDLACGIVLLCLSAHRKT